MDKEKTDCVAEDRPVFGITGDLSIAVLDPGVWYKTVCEGSCMFRSPFSFTNRVRDGLDRSMRYPLPIQIVYTNIN